MPSRFRLRCLTVAKESRFEKIALVLQKQLYEIGVDMQIEALTTDEMVKRLKTGDFDTILIQRASARSIGWTYLDVPFHTNADRVLGCGSGSGPAAKHDDLTLKSEPPSATSSRFSMTTRRQFSSRGRK